MMMRWALVVACVLGAGFLAPPISVAQPASATPRTAVVAAANALGGLERIQQIRNITLQGYGQYAYMFGGGNIVGSEHAPMKFEAANELSRVYDLEHDRYQQRERRNFLFPFAITGGHNYHVNNEILDGGLVYNVQPDGSAVRISRWKEDAHQVDGVHMRRMWSINNPIAAVRAALDPAAQLAPGKPQVGVTTIQVTMKQGDRFTLALDPRSHLPAWVRWTNPQTNLGQIQLTTYYSGYTPHDGLLLPLGYTTNFDWRNIPYLKLYVDAYVIDGKIPDLAAPQSVRDAPEPPDSVPPIVATEITKGIWRLSSGTTVLEFADHLTLFELNQSQLWAKASIDAARKLVPDKPVTQVIASHGHFDHVAGIRTAVAEGLTVISRRGNEGIIREQVTHPAPDYPDAQARNPKPLKFIPVDEHLRLSDEALTVDLYWARDNIHMADAIFAYVPAAKLIVEADIATAAFDYQWWPDSYMDNVEFYKLDVEMLSPVHSVWPEHPGVLTQAQVIELIQGGVKRARERCASELAKGNYFPGCPVLSARY